jgi:alpha 1,2-mannosyltransferase
MTPVRYIVLVLGIIITLHYILSLSHDAYGRATSLSTIKAQFGGHTPPYKTPVPPDYYTHPNTNGSFTDRKASAAIVMLARNSDLKGIVASMKQMEDRFNKKFRYPYVFLNEELFSDEFRKRVTDLTDASVQFGLIPRDHWHQPGWINETKATEAREDMIKNQVIYGGSVPYRNMCRFYSGFFYRHELLKPFKYYWRVECVKAFFSRCVPNIDTDFPKTRCTVLL